MSNKKIESMEEFLVEYCDEDTLRAHQCFDHITWLDMEDDSIIGFISYFRFHTKDWDMVVSHNKDNVYTLQHWKVLSKLLKTRTKEIVINSDSSNNVLHKGAKKYGGYFIGDDLHFPINNKDKETS